MLGIHLLRSSGPPKTDTWIARYGTSGVEYGRGVAVDSTGFTYTIDSTFTIIKSDAFGRFVWQKRVGSSNTGYGIAIDSSDNIYAVGDCNDDRYNSSYSDGLLAKIDTDGALQWVRSFYIPSKNVFLRAVAVHTDGSVYCVGHNATDQTPIAVKYNSSGTFQWGQYYSASNATYFTACTVDSSGVLVAVGQCEVGYPGNPHFLVVRINSAGSEILKTLVGSGTSSGVYFGKYVVTDSSNNIYVCGLVLDAVFAVHTNILKLNSSGVIQWQKQFYETTESDTNTPSGLAIDALGDLYLSHIWTSGGSSMAVTKISVSTGALTWSNRITGADSISVFGNFSVDGDFVNVAGNIALSGNDVLLAKIPKDGTGTGTFGAYFTYSALSGYTYSTSSMTTASVSMTLTSFTTNRTPSIPVATQSYDANIYYYEG